MELDIYFKELYIRIASTVAEQLKLMGLRKKNKHYEINRIGEA